MNKYLIEVPHGSGKHACDEAIKIFLETGSHFLTHADWGCMDGEHKAWLIVEVENKEDAKFIIPPRFRSTAKITQIVNFTGEEFVHTDELHHD